MSFDGLQVRPERPKVGDEVELHFDAEIAVYSLTQLDLVGAELLAGETTLRGTRDATFQLTAVQAGRMTVELVVAYGTEERCVDSSGGFPYFVYGPNRTVTSPSYVVDIAEAACIGDCDRDGEVTVDELLTMVNVALGNTVIFSCLAGDADGDRAVQVTEIVGAVNGALNGCGGPEAGYCYESSNCSPSLEYPFAPFNTNRGRCCELQRRGSVPFSWCPASMFDPATAVCMQCLYPC